jgi:hypothetical protein
MSRRRIAFASIAVVTVLCLVGVSVLAVAAGGSALAYEVNGTRVSQDDFDAQLHNISDEIAAAREKANQPESENPPDGTIVSSTTAALLNITILRALLRDAADAKGVKVTNDDRTAGEQAAQQSVQSFSQAPLTYQKGLIELFAYANALGLTDSDALNTFVAAQVKKADVYINPRYGTWSPRTGVCAPTGCAATG